MSINSIFLNSVGDTLKTTSTSTSTVTPYEAQKSFSNFLKDAIENVNETQVNSDTLTQKLANGEDVELHDVMIASQKASITLDATMEVRNKVVDAYQEIMRMQV